MCHYAWHIPHPLMMFLGIIGKRFGDAGYRDILVQSEVIADGSVDRALTGKMYNRSVRAVKLTYEALSRLLVEKFEFESDPEFAAVLSNLKEIIRFNENLSRDGLDTLLNSENLKIYNEKYIDFIDNLKSHGGELALFWISYIEMAQILLNILYATTSGNWELLLESLKGVVPYTFAYDNVNYARYLT